MTTKIKAFLLAVFVVSLVAVGAYLTGGESAVTNSTKLVSSLSNFRNSLESSGPSLESVSEVVTSPAIRISFDIAHSLLSNPQAQPELEKRLRAELLEWNREDWRSLGAALLDTKLSFAERQAALFIASQGGSAALQVLTDISEMALPVKAQDPHTAEAAQYEFEVRLRISALEALDQLAVAEPEEVKVHLNQILHMQKDPRLSFLAKTSLEGIEAGNPGKLKRLIEKMMESP